MNILDTIDIAKLDLVKYPDPRLREVCRTVEVFDDRLRALTEKMFAIMYERNGVGLAGPQVGVPLRLFTANPTLEPADERVYINPTILKNDGRQDGDEGCLSFPGIFCKIKRFNVTTIQAQDLTGESFTETGEGLLARIFQHESDHLAARLLVDRMSVAAKLANRRAIKNLEAVFAD